MKRIVIASDIQAPFEDKAIIRGFTQFLKDYQPDELLCVGDEADSPEVSRWKKGLAGEYSGTLQAGLDRTRNILRGFREAIGPDTPFTIHRSNHTDRIKMYVDRFAPGLTGLRALDYATLVGYDELDITFNPRPKEVAPGWVMVHGDESGMNRTPGGTALGIARKISKSVVAGHCFDESTEILTEYGWRTHGQLVAGERVATFNKETQEIEFQPINEIHRYSHFKELLVAENEYVSLAVTDKHGLVVDEESHLRFPKAEEVFGTKITIPVAASTKKSEEQETKLSDSKIDLLAYTLAQGITQSQDCIYFLVNVDEVNEKNVLPLETILTSCGFDYEKLSVTKNLGKVAKIKLTDSRALALIFALLNYDLTPSRELRDLPINDQRRLLHQYGRYRGSDEGDGQVLYSSASSITDYFQEVASLSSLRSRTSWNHKTKLNELHIDSPRTTVATIKAKNWSKREYEGIVWCVSVDNGTLLVRRNGKTAITQNTHALGLQHDHSYMNGKIVRRLYGMEVGHMMDLSKAEYLKLGTANWNAGFGILYVHKDKTYPAVVPIIGKSFVVEGQLYKFS